jgi:poly(3-hydroxyalkanoate) synthetase
MQLQKQDGKALVTAMLNGLRLYQDHPFSRPVDPLPVVWAEGTAQLFYAAADKPVASVFIVPSMINRSHILDLLPNKSFVRWLAARGIDVYLLDWGTPVDDAAMIDVEGVIGQRLLPALRAAREHTAGPLYALGYCMGGTLLSAAAAPAQDMLAGMAFLASPWDFHAGDRALTSQIQAGTPQALNMMVSRHVLPVDWIQTVFATVNEDRTVHKFANFAAMTQDSAEAELFVAVEDWLNDGMDLPAPLARTCIRDWYGDNLPGRGQWEVAGAAVNPAAITVPSLVVAPMRDRLVPAGSALALAKLLPDVTVLEPDCGHIGMMSGRSAEGAVWEPVWAWICGRHSG